MASPNWALVIIEVSILTYLAGLTITHGDSVCGNQGNYPQNSAYAKNLNDTLSALPDATKGDGFFSASSSSAEDNETSTAYARVLCPGDFQDERCLACVRSGTDRLRQDCPNQIKATGWYFGTCMFSYSNGSFDMVDGDNKDVLYFLTGNIPSSNSVDETLENLFNKLRGKAATDGFNETFYSGGIALTGSTGNIQGTMQCIPNVTRNKCDECIVNATSYLLRSYNGSAEGVVYYGYSCLLKYTVNGVNIEDPSIPNPGKSRSKVIIPAVVAAAVILAVSTFIFLKFRRICSKRGEDEELFEASDDETGEIIYFRLKEIQAATRYFSAANKLGEGGFGPVYWGELSDGKKAWMLWHEGNGEQLIDENLCDDCPVGQALKFMHIALLCIEEDPNDRPTMSSVAFMLEGEWKSLSEPKHPMSFGQFVTSDKSSSTWNGNDSSFYSSNGSIVHTGKSLEIKGIGHRGL
ncbi:hypothetical protein L2E82_31303 [Cichorium intybus]|uniref:Uncharacterized protein n=1 Tax=Cichorium intybus TaxID=13427 RepID=A0ACB9D2L2_CICIN|nr:hypothetical protein L2E82_31303 [Cichorium intybus]